MIITTILYAAVMLFIGAIFWVTRKSQLQYYHGSMAEYNLMRGWMRVVVAVVSVTYGAVMLLLQI